MTRSIMIDAPPDEVFEYALDVGKFWTWDDVALTDVHLAPGGVGTSARMFTHLLGFHIEGGLEYTEVVPGQRIVVHVHFFGESPTWTFTFEAADGGTKVLGQGEWHAKIPVLGKPIETMMVKEHESGLEAMLANLKQQVEAHAAA